MFLSQTEHSGAISGCVEFCSSFYKILFQCLLWPRIWIATQICFCWIFMSFPSKQKKLNISSLFFHSHSERDQHSRLESALTLPVMPLIQIMLLTFYWLSRATGCLADPIWPYRISFDLPLLASNQICTNTGAHSLDSVLVWIWQWSFRPCQKNAYGEKTHSNVHKRGPYKMGSLIKVEHENKCEFCEGFFLKLNIQMI